MLITQGALPRTPDARAVADAFRLGRPLARLVSAARGELGRIWRLETATGTWAVKELFRPSAETEARADVAFQEAALAGGIPMPRPIVGRDGRVLAEVGPADRSGDRPVIVRAYTWVDLARPVRSAPAAEAAAILGRLHALQYPADGPIDPWFTVPVAPERWQELLKAAERAGAPWAATLAEIVPILVAGDSIVAEGRHRPAIRCHRDFNPENVLLDASGHIVVIDWENSGPAAAEQELASALAEFVPDPAGVRAFLRAYSASGGSAKVTDRSSFAMTLGTQANLVAWYADRALDATATNEDRARAAHWIGDIAANAFTPARIDGWLAATATADR